MTAAAALTPDDVVERGKAIYEQSIRAEVEADNIGKLLMIDVLTGNWVLGEDRIKMARHLRGQNPDAANYALRVGYPATLGIGVTVRPFSKTNRQSNG